MEVVEEVAVPGYTVSMGLTIFLQAALCAYLMVTPLELRMSTLCLFLGFSASASLVTLLLAPLLSDLYTAAMAGYACDEQAQCD